jgi:phosphatidylglycerol:prolipoprotein diacylglycerol transferase
MYPTLAHAVHDWFGLELHPLKLINTLGLFVALGFLGAALSLRSELDRKHTEGKIPSTREAWSPPRTPTGLLVALSGFVAFLIGFKVLGLALGSYPLQGGADVRRYLLSRQGDGFGGMLCGALWIACEVRRRNRLRTPPEEHPSFADVKPRDHLIGITGSVALGALVGSKLFHLLERPSRIIELIEQPSLAALFSGHTVYGGLIAGALGGYVYCRRNRLPFIPCVDAAAPGLMLGYGIGRLGCQLAGDGDWGVVSSGAPHGFGWMPSWFWGYDFPNNVIHAGVPMPSGGYPGYGTHLAAEVYPTSLYESLAASVAFSLLWFVRRRIERPLVMLGLYLMLNGTERFWIEKIRVNATYELLGSSATQAEIIAVALFFSGLALVVLQLRRPAPSPPVAEVQA